MNLSAADAKYLLAGFGVITTMLIAWLPTIKISDYIKFGILAVFSLVGGYLTIVSTGQLLDSGSLVQNGALVLTAAQIFYYGAFRVLGLEKVLFPQQALATEVKEQSKETIPTISSEKAKDILDPKTPADVLVTTQVVNTPV